MQTERIWGDLTSQPVPVILGAALFNISPDNTTIIKMRQTQ